MFIDFAAIKKEYAKLIAGRNAIVPALRRSRPNDLFAERNGEESWRVSAQRRTNVILCAKYLINVTE